MLCKHLGVCVWEVWPEAVLLVLLGRCCDQVCAVPQQLLPAHPELLIWLKYWCGALPALSDQCSESLRVVDAV